MIKGHFLVLTWFFTLLVAFLFSSLMLVYVTFPKLVTSPAKQPYQLFQALPEKTNFLSDHYATVEAKDARSLIIYNFFKGYNSPLADYSDKFVETADKYQLDYRLLPAISMQESNGGKFIPDGSYNPFGYGIYGSMIMKFDSFDQAIDRVGRGLQDDYINQGLVTPYQIMTKYTPPSLEKGGSWAIGVSTFMDELK